MIEGLFHIYDLKLLHKLFSFPTMLTFHKSWEYTYEINMPPVSFVHYLTNITIISKIFLQTFCNSLRKTLPSYLVQQHLSSLNLCLLSIHVGSAAFPGSIPVQDGLHIL